MLRWLGFYISTGLAAFLSTILRSNCRELGFEGETDALLDRLVLGRLFFEEFTIWKKRRGPMFGYG